MAMVTLNGIEYLVQQINGQKIVSLKSQNILNGVEFEHKEIFIGNIPKNINEVHLLKIFADIGPIFQFRLMMSFSGENRGFGYLRYVFEVHFYRALQTLNRKQVIPGRFIRACVSRNICTLVMGGIYGNFSPYDLLQAVRLMLDLKSSKLSVKGCAVKYYFTFRSHREAALGKRQLLSVLPYYGRGVWIRWATEHEERFQGE